MPKSKKKRSSEGPMPAAGAGLIRFFADQSEGIKVGPVSVLLLSIFLIVVVLLAWYQVFTFLGFPPL
ncbi:MAG: preprotein translocase subunit Sec61beta [Promethearchaeota archaeon]